MDGGYAMKDAPANFIGGEWQTEPDTMPAVNPATGETIAQLPRSGRETVQR
ncbi:aldehyde dehydrogenase, partial [Mesorhizobium sp. M7A.F.Ca.CA.004.07.1.1]